MNEYEKYKHDEEDDLGGRVVMRWVSEIF